MIFEIYLVDSVHSPVGSKFFVMLLATDNYA